MGQMFHFRSYVANELQKPPAALGAIIDSLNTMSASLFAPVRCWTFCPTIFNIYQFLLSLAPHCSLSYPHTRWTNFFSVMYTHKPFGENINLRSATLNCYYLLFFLSITAACVWAWATVTFFFRQSPTPELNLATDSYTQMQLQLSGLQLNLCLSAILSQAHCLAVLLHWWELQKWPCFIFVTIVRDDV